MNDTFTLYDLDISVVGDSKTFVCEHTSGHAFKVKGENIIFDSENNRFSMYAFATLLLLLPAKQRPTHKNDWMTTDELIACPDPNCGAQFKITRQGKSTFSHAQATKVPLR